MAVYLRETSDPDLWYAETQKEWLDSGHIPADALSDLKTDDNTLSVYEVTDEASAKRVVASLALLKHRAHTGAKDGSKIKNEKVYFLFDSRLADDAGISVIATRAQTADAVVNEWHRDLSRLSGAKLVELATAMLRVSKPVTVHVDELLEQLERAEREAYIPAGSIPARIREQIAERGPA